MTDQQKNALSGTVILLFVLVLCGFFAALCDSKAGEIAQSLGNIVGGALGAAAAFAVALWTIAESRREISKQAENAKALIQSDLRSVAISVLNPLMLLRFETSPDGRLGSAFFRRLSRPSLSRHLDARFPTHLLDVSSVIQLEYLTRVVSAYNQFLDQAASAQSVVPDDLQRQIWSQLDHMRTQTAEAMRMFSESGRDVFAAQLDSFIAFTYCPTVGQPFSGAQNGTLFLMLNEISREFAQRRP